MHDRNRAPVEALLEFGRFRVLLRRRQLLADGETVRLGTRAFDLLLVLIEAGGRLVSKHELLDRVWPDTVVEENNLQVQISALRKVFGQEQDLIRTEFGRGYRFTGEVRSIPGAADGRSPPAAAITGDPNGALPTVPARLSDLAGNEQRLAEVLRLLDSHHVVLLTIPTSSSVTAMTPAAGGRWIGH